MSKGHIIYFANFEQLNKMKKLFTTIIAAVFLSFAAQAQMAEPVNWTFTAEKINANEYQIKLTANIEEGWYVYSQNLPKHATF